MRYAEFVKKYVKLEFKETRKLSLDDIYCEFNPDRFKYWRATFKQKFDESSVLWIGNSPHCDFLRKERTPIYRTRYYNLMKMYGRSDDWITRKCDRFQWLYEDIQKNGIGNNPIILDRPIAENQFNSGFQIYEGHHRCAIACVLGFNPKVDIYSWKQKK